jgi:hypothetical protein
MFYLYFAIFSLGTAMLQSSYIRAPKGSVPTRRRVTYSILAALATCIQILVGCFQFGPIAGAFLFVPVFYAVNKGLRSISLRLRYTFRIGLLLVLLTGYPLIHDTWKALGLSQ